MEPAKPLPREAWVVIGFVLGILVGGGSVKASDLVAVSDVVCPEADAPATEAVDAE